MRKLFRSRLCVFLACLAANVSAAAEGANPPPGQSPGAGGAGVPLKQLVLTDSLAAAETVNFAANAGFVVFPSTLSFVNQADLAKRLAPGENQIVNDKLLLAIVQVVEGFFRQNDFPIARVEIPPQNIEDGAIGVAVSLGKFREIKFQGNRWFSEAAGRPRQRHPPLRTGSRRFLDQ
jgi:hemolysin activation/secretion protein